MITAGIDMGNQTIKVVILNNYQIVSHSIVIAGIDAKGAAERAMEEALCRASLNQTQVGSVIATGAGREEAPFAQDCITEVSCDARGVIHLFPSAKTVVDIGAEESRAMRIDSTGKVLDFAKNDKCAAGVGTFVEAMAKALELRVEQMGEVSLCSDKEVPMNVTCVVFAESEVISLIHGGVKKADIARAIHDAIASRTTSMTRKLKVEKDVVLIGGVAKNIGVVKSLEKQLGLTILIPEEPQIVGALGAALFAEDRGG